MFAERLKELRLEADLKQSDLAKIIEVSSSTIGMYEQGRRFPDQDILNKLANYFDISVDYLLGRTKEKNPNPKLDEGIKTIAAHRINPHDDLPDDAIEKINEYIEMVRLKYKK